MASKEMTGMKLAEFVFPVERGKIKEFARAILDPNPVYRDREYAKSQGFDDILVPVTFPAMCHHLDTENFPLEMASKLDMDPTKSIHGEFEIIYERPVCAGETLRGEIIVGNIYEKGGKRGGKMIFVEVEWKFFDAKDKPVILIRNVHMQLG